LAVGSYNGFQKRQKNINDRIAEIFVNKEEKNVILVLGKRDGHNPATEKEPGMKRNNDTKASPWYRRTDTQAAENKRERPGISTIYTKSFSLCVYFDGSIIGLILLSPLIRFLFPFSVLSREKISKAIRWLLDDFRADRRRIEQTTACLIFEIDPSYVDFFLGIIYGSWPDATHDTPNGSSSVGAQVERTPQQPRRAGGPTPVRPHGPANNRIKISHWESNNIQQVLLGSLDSQTVFPCQSSTLLSRDATPLSLSIVTQVNSHVCPSAYITCTSPSTL
jgi:hypothetical protein